MKNRKPETQRHLDAADCNYRLAVALLTDAVNLVEPPAYDWVLIIAFYASVRYINAYHWQRFDADPVDHQARNGFVNRVDAFDSVAEAYNLLYGRSRAVRYKVGSAVNEQAARAALSIAERVRNVVLPLL